MPGLGVTLVEKPVRGVVSNGMLCSAAELEYATESDGIMELPDSLAVGTPVVVVRGAVDPWPGVLDSVERFDTETNQWDFVAPMRTARSLAAGALIDGRIYVAGGRGPGSRCLRGVEYYTPSTDAWTSMRKACGACATGPKPGVTA